MKKVYEKPMISVESMNMDMPVALNCNANTEDMSELIDWGYFGENDRGVKCDWKFSDGEHYTICYHSNIQTAFLS